MKNKKLKQRIGICTMYYGNSNYGANLQAFALVNVVNSIGYETELVSYYSRRLPRFLALIKDFFVTGFFNKKNFAVRKNAITAFSKSIPHSVLYYPSNIADANKDYDIFVVGSDQVWNPSWINKFYSLDFVDKDKLTIAYAASTGKVNLNDQQKHKLQIAVDNTKYISIREEDSIPSLMKLTDKKIEYVLDPTMLLSKDEWDGVCSKRLIEDDYILCYFLGGNQNLRDVAEQYAKLRKLKIVCLPYLNGAHRDCDDNFGDYRLYDVSPKDFISLIKYATFVMTDSFHGTVFSHIYERKFLVSGGGKDEMGCRMKSLTTLFGTTDRYILEHDMVNLEQMVALDDKIFSINWEKFNLMKKHSIDFLRKALADENNM